MRCTNLRIRSKKYTKYFYCTFYKKEIDKTKCFNCKNVTYKEYKRLTAKTELKKRTSKLNKLERNRFSLFTNNLDICFICKRKKDHIHEIFAGRNRQNSMKYGLCLPLCSECHSKYQNDKEFNDKWHIKGQKAFNKKYPDLKFQDIFRINYL